MTLYGCVLLRGCCNLRARVFMTTATIWLQVPLYDTLGPDAIVFILKQSQMATVFAAKSETASVRLQPSSSFRRLLSAHAIITMNSMIGAHRCCWLNAAIESQA